MVDYDMHINIFLEIIMELLGTSFSEHLMPLQNIYPGKYNSMCYLKNDGLYGV